MEDDSYQPGGICDNLVDSLRGRRSASALMSFLRVCQGREDVSAVIRQESRDSVVEVACGGNTAVQAVIGLLGY